MTNRQSNGPATGGAPPSDIDRVRELLFGRRSQELDERIAALEATVAQQDSALRDLVQQLRAEVDAKDAERGTQIAALADGKVDRAALAAMLVKLAEQIGGNAGSEA